MFMPSEISILILATTTLLSLAAAVVHDRLETVRLLTSMVAHINSRSLSKRMGALLKEVRDRREAHRESRKQYLIVGAI